MTRTKLRTVRSKSETNDQVSSTRTMWRQVFFISTTLVLGSNLLSAQVNVLSANYDNARTNSNLSETLLNPSNVNPRSFGKTGSFPVDGQIYAQALYVAGVQIPDKGVRNVVYTVTMHNSVYAIDADAPGSIKPLWQVSLGPSVPSSVLNFIDIVPEVGILGTPVIDLGWMAIYVVSETLEAGNPVFRMHALSLSDGHEMFHGPVVIAASVPGIGDGSNNGTLSFDASLQLQRPGLVLANGTVYAAFGSHADVGAFHGWMIGYDASDLRRRVAVFNATPNALGGSFWQAGRAPAVDDAGNIFAVTGNGDFNGASEFSDSVLKLSGHDLSLLDWYTPDNWADLRDHDKDLGSAGAILMPGANQLLTAGKSGHLFLISGGSMGHLGPMNSPTVQSIAATPNGVFDFALWNRPDGSIVYVQEPWGPLQSYRISGGRLDDAILSQSNPITPILFAGIAISADSGTDGTGIVWQTTGDNKTRGIPGTLHALDAMDLTNELWNSDMVPTRDTLGRYPKFVAPTIVNGRVYVPTFSGQLAIYGLLSDGDPAASDIQVTAVANGASLLAHAVSPGEVVTIYGAHLGPEQLSASQVGDNLHATSVLGDTQVLFDGVPAPLLSTWSGEVGAVVPFGTAGSTTQVQVGYHGQWSGFLAVPVAPAAPALFAQDGTGGGPGAVLNDDGSINSRRNPANRGSVITLLGTGLGRTSPLGEDGKIADGLAPAVAALPVTVLIDGQPAEILYTGAAPGMVQGIVQVNVKIPATVNPGSGVPLVLKAGDYASPNTVRFAVK